MTRSFAMKLGAACAGATFAVTFISLFLITQAQTAPTPPTAATRPGPVTPALQVPVQTPAVPLAGANLRETNDTRVYAAVKDAIVNITSSRMVTAQVSTGTIFDLIQPQFRQVQAQSLGSG